MPFYCPPGFDCGFRTACPVPVLQCAPGFFCDSYAGHPQESQFDLELDIRFKETPPPNKRVSIECFRGFHCPNATSLVPCPAGTWCAEGVSKPTECSAVSLCGEMNTFEVALEPVIICVLLALLTGALSCWLIRRQRTMDRVTKSKLAAPTSTSLPTSPGAPSTHLSVATASKSTTPEQQRSQAAGHHGVGLSFSTTALTVKAGESTLLDAIDCTISAGKVTAILGPSQCGKSLLVDVLRGRAAAASLNVSGAIKLNGVPVESMVPWAREVGFVPQDDILDRRMTVRELLWLTARQRLPGTTENSAVSNIVDSVMSELGLSKVAHTIVGGSGNAAANISGGQLKRVNVALELVSQPAAIILDSPTNGLDATSALDLMRMLRTIAQRGVTVVVILQQPRWEVFECIDHLILMASKGRIVYEGSAGSAVDYIQTHAGYRKPDLCNPSDWLIDVLTGLAQPVASETQTRSSTASPHAAVSQPTAAGSVVSIGDQLDRGMAVDLPSLWKRMAPSVRDTTTTTTPASANTNSSRNNSPSGSIKPVNASTIAKVDVPVRQPMNFWGQFVAAACADSIINLRARSAVLTFSLLHAIMALALSSGFSSLLHGSPRASVVAPLTQELAKFCPPFLRERCRQNVLDIGLQQLLFFITMTVGSAGSIASTRVFGDQSQLFKRLNESGLSVVPVAIGRMTADLLIVALNALVFSATWKLMANTGAWGDWVVTILLLAWSASGFGYFASMLTDGVNAGVLCMIATVCFSVFSGVEPTLSQVKSLSIVAAPWYLSYGTWAASAAFNIFTAFLRQDRDMSNAAAKYGYDAGDLGPAFAGLFLIGLAWRIIAILTLAYTSGGFKSWFAARASANSKRARVLPARAAATAGGATVAVV